MNRTQRLLRRDGAFTLVELLVVIGVIAVLIGILLPSLNKARKQAQLIQCASNMRQWGLGWQMYINQYNGFLPWTAAGDGYAATKSMGPWDDTALWFNAIPPMMNGKKYSDLIASGHIPTAGTNSIFVCPAAAADASTNSSDKGGTLAGTFLMYGDKPADPNGTVYSKPEYLLPQGSADPNTVTSNSVYWSYVTNSKIDNSLAKMPGSNATTSYFLRSTLIRQSALTPILVERMATPGEINQPPLSLGLYTGSINRSKTTWTRFAARHNGGGNLLFLDGHVAFFAFKELQPPGSLVVGQVGNVTNGPTNNPAYNVAGKVIWDPYQFPLYGS